MKTPEKVEITVEGLEILAEAVRSVANYLDIAAKTMRQFVAEWNRFEEEVPHQTGQLSR